jgi:hypothetical protein
MHCVLNNAPPPPYYPSSRTPVVCHPQPHRCLPWPALHRPLSVSHSSATFPQRSPAFTPQPLDGANGRVIHSPMAGSLGHPISSPLGLSTISLKSHPEVRDPPISHFDLVKVRDDPLQNPIARSMATLRDPLTIGVDSSSTSTSAPPEDKACHVPLSHPHHHATRSQVLTNTQVCNQRWKLQKGGVGSLGGPIHCTFRGFSNMSGVCAQYQGYSRQHPSGCETYETPCHTPP